MASTSKAQKIRDDLVGSVWVETDGQKVMLEAGSDVPEGVELGSHVLQDGPEHKADVAAAKKAAGDTDEDA